MRRILVTGSSGRVGRDVVRALRADWHVAGFDRAPPPADGPHEFVPGDLTDPDAVARAVSGAAVVVHLAAAADDDPLPETLGQTPPDEDNFLSQLVPANLVGPVMVLKAVSINDLQTGQAIVVRGATNSDGTVTASNVAEGVGVFGRGGGFGGRFGGGGGNGQPPDTGTQTQ